MFEQDRTFREALSDKTKARLMGIKEKFTPLNIIRMLTGSGGIGRSIRTVAGRAMGYSERDIERFGGYKRKRSIYGPDRSRVPAGSRSAAKMNDSTADILAKIYNLLRKIDEDNTRRYEREQEFAEENKLEEENRQNKFLSFFKGKRNKSGKTGASTEDKPEEDKSGGIISKIFGSIFGVMKKLLGVFGALGTIFGLVTSFMGKIRGIFSNVLGLVVEMITPLLEGLFKSIVKFIFNVLPRFASNLLDLISKVGGTLSDVIDNLSGIDEVKKMKLKSSASRIGMATVMSGVFDDEGVKYNPLYVGKQASELYKQAEQAQASVDYLYPGVKEGDYFYKNKKKAFDEKVQPLLSAAEQYASDYRLNLIPNLEKKGYELKSYDKNGIPIFKNNKGESPTAGELLTAASIENSDFNMSDFISPKVVEKLDPRRSEVYNKVFDELHDLQMQTFIVTRKLDEIPKIIEDLNPGEQAKNVVEKVKSSFNKAKTANERRISIDEVSIRDPLLQGPNGPIRWVYENK
jgi:hypothetical protein